MEQKKKPSKEYKNPPTAVDIIIEVYAEKKEERGRNEIERKSACEDLQGIQGIQKILGIVLVKRGKEPFEGRWALPGGFQEWEESLENTAVREAKEETGLDITLLGQLSVYSNPGRDPRGPVNGVGYVASAQGVPNGGDDAAEAKIFPLDALPKPLAFDHDKRLEEYALWRKAHK